MGYWHVGHAHVPARDALPVQDVVHVQSEVLDYQTQSVQFPR